MNSFLSSGKFQIGANYWASHAGPAMWRKWNADIVARDFSSLSQSGLQVLRIFPLWPDFQPINALRGYLGNFVEYRHGEAPLPDDQVYQNGVSPEMLDRFGVVADLAAKNNLDLIVGLITGWMSARLFVPPALEGLNPITDPISIMWQVRLIQAIVGRFKDHPAIKAWDLGNECNCLGSAATREQAWIWSSTITSTIRAIDSQRPVVSGMHSLSADPSAIWNIRDQGEIADILTTHPYPFFTPHCHREPHNSFRPILHAAAETCLYSDLSQKPAFVEEFGNLGPMFSGEEETAGFVRASLTSQWAHDARGALWWCAHDQVSLEEAPHDWVALERELGLLREDGSGKPVLREFKAFRAAIEQLSFRELPSRKIDAVCILTPGQDQWGVAYTAFLLAKQAGFDLRFHYADRALPDAQLYLLPSIQGTACLSRRREIELWDKVRAGADVYFSLGDGVLADFSRVTGLDLLTRSERKEACSFAMQDESGSFEIAAPMQYEFRVRDAKVLAAETSGRPVFSVSKLGLGKVYHLSIPLEAALSTVRQHFSSVETPPFWKIYRTFAKDVLEKRILGKTHPFLGITEHKFENGDFLTVLINYSPNQIEDVISVAENFTLLKTEMGIESEVNASRECRINLPPHGCSVWRFAAKN